MSLSKEVRIGLLVTIAIVVFCTGFYFLKGANLFSSEKEYTCFYDNVNGLQTSATVQIRGLAVGRVAHTQLVDGKGVKVIIAVNKSIDIPKGTIASLASSDLLGSKIVRLDLGNGPGVVEAGETLPSAIEGGLIDNLSVQMTPLLKQVRGVVADLDTVLLGVTGIVNTQNQAALANSLASLEKTTHNFDVLSASLGKESGEITNIVHNANSVTTNLANNNASIQHILRNADSLSAQLSHAPIQQTFTDLQHTMSELQGIVNKINTNQGSLGELINNKDLYDHLNTTLGSLNSLMADLQAHPSRYINVTVFGKKKP
jgi:phospholipid/cholesterol/gamma-HCH transport system substrate-binding protein